MKKIIRLLLIAFVFGNCDFHSEDINSEDINSADYAKPGSVLYGTSNFDNAFYFVKVSGRDGEFKVLNKLEGVTSVTGQAAINAELMHYYFISTGKMVVVNISDGSILKTFKLKYFNTGNLQYNSSSKKLNAICNFDGKMYFVDIDIEKEQINVIHALNLANGYEDGSSSIDSANEKYYVVGSHTLYTVDTQTGTFTDSLALTNNIGGLRIKKPDELFGLDLSSNNHHFLTINLKSNQTETLQSFERSLTGHPSLDGVNGFYYFFSDRATLNRVNVNSSVLEASYTLPQPTNNLIPL